MAASSKKSNADIVEKVIAKNASLYQDWLLHRFPDFSNNDKDSQSSFEPNVSRESESRLKNC